MKNVKILLLIGLVSLMIIIAGCGENMAGNARATGQARPSKQLAVPTCPGGTACDGTPVTGKDGQVVCGTDLQNWKCTGKGWEGTGQKCVCPAASGSGTATFSSYMKIKSKCMEMYSGCDNAFFEKAFFRNKIVGTDFAKYYIVKKEEGSSVSVTSAKALANEMYAQITEQQAQEIAELLLLEEAKKKQFIISDAKLNQGLKGSMSSGMSAGANELKQQNSGSSLKDDKDGLLAIKKLIDGGSLTALEIGKSNSGSKEGGTDETNKASQAGDTPKASAFSGKGNFMQAGVSSCANAAKGKGKPGSSGAKSSDSGSSGGAAGGGSGGGNPAAMAEKTGGSGGGSSGGSTGDVKVGGGGGSTDGANGNKGGAKPQGGGFAKTPSGGGAGDSDDGQANSEFAKDQASGKGAPCQAVNWDAVSGDTGKAGLQIFAKNFNTKEFQGWAVVRIKDGTKTTTLIGKDGDGKPVDQEKKEKAKPGEGSNDKIGVPIKTKDGGTATLNVPKETDTDNKPKDDKDKSKDGKDGDSKGGDSKGDSAKGDGSSSKSKGMTDPSAETAKSNLKKCDSSWASAYSGCVMNLLMDEFKTDDKSTGQDKCEKVGQGGPDATLNCGKKSYGKDGLDVNLFFGTGSSQGAGVTDPADK